MYQVTKRISFCYGHRLLHHAGKCSRYHGHNGIAEIVCESETLDSHGMVIDFDRISETVKSWIDDHLDHVMILNEKDDLIPLLKKKSEPYISMPEDPTAEAIAKIIYDQACRQKLPVKQVTLWETPTASATYHP